MPLTGCLSQEQQQQLAQGFLPADEAEAVANHLEHCPHCGDAVDLLLRTSWLVESVRAGPPPEAPPADDDLIDRLKGLARLPLQEQTAQGALRSSSPSTLPPEEDWTFLAPRQQPDELGRLGTFRILGVLGQGGMGVVFRAEDTQLQ